MARVDLGADVHGGDLHNMLCGRCRSRVGVTIQHIPVALFPAPPRQWQRYVRHVKWQCLAVEDHYGTYTCAVDNTTWPGSASQPWSDDGR